MTGAPIGLHALWLATLALLASMTLTGFAAAESTAATAGGVDPTAVARRLAALGPRVPGTPAHAAAREFLLAELARVGLAEVAAEPVPGRPELANLSGVLPGRGEGEVVLAAHYDSVPASPGAADDASGCGVVLAAAADLARTPLVHGVRVVLFDGEERDLAGSRAWIEGREEEGRRRLLAGVEVEMVGWGGACGPTLAALPAYEGPAGREGRRALPPGWLVHAALRGSESAGRPLAFLHPRWSFPAQLLLRVADPAWTTDAVALMAGGVPAVVLTEACPGSTDPENHASGDRADRLDPRALERWAAATAAVVRRLDALAGRPIPEDDYLVIASRVWLRRDLYWIGFGLWAALVVAGYRRRTAGRDRPGAFLFRFLFLVSTLAAPALAAPLVYPAGLLSLLPAATRRRRLLLAVLGLLPAAALAAGTAAAALAGLTTRWALGALPSLLLTATLAAYARMMADSPTAPSTPAPASPGTP